MRGLEKLEKTKSDSGRYCQCRYFLRVGDQIREIFEITVDAEEQLSKKKRMMFHSGVKNLTWKDKQEKG